MAEFSKTVTVKCPSDAAIKHGVDGSGKQP